MANASAAPAPLQAIRRLARRRHHEPPPAPVSFAELVWAHFLRQRELHEKGDLQGEAEAEYRQRLEIFEQAEGRLVNAYWCTTEASGVAITEKRHGLLKRTELRYHSATDWVAREAHEVANTLHMCDTLAVRVTAVLGGTPERIAMQWILAAAGHALGFIDRDHLEDGKKTNRLVNRKRRELEQIENYYHAAGEKQGRLKYFFGMMIGVVAVGAIGGLVGSLLWWKAGLDPNATTNENLIVSYSMGAVGALVSVMTRMASTKDRFTVDFELGRGQLLGLGSFRPFIGAVSALIVFCAVQGNLIQVLPDGEQSIYLFAVLAFGAGFSERWAKVALGTAGRMLGGEDDAPPGATPAPKPKPPIEEGSRHV
jgi:cytochrome c biogenesis protein CcdA